MQIIYPDYENCLTNLTNSILKYFDITPYHKTLKELDKVLEENKYDNVVLLIYDGMGSNILNRNLAGKSFLRKNKLTDIKAVFPPTTTASTTTLLSGLNPIEHGWLGWDLYFKWLDETVTMFLNTIKDTGILVSEENIAHKYFPYKSIIDLINEKYKAYKIVPFDENPYSDLEDLNNRIINLCKEKGKKFIYAYCDEPDHTTHSEGTDSNITIKLYEELDRSTKELCNNLKNTNTLVIVTADHGHINSIPITLSDYKDVLQELSNDDRIPLYISNLVMLTKVDKRTYKVKRETLYSILDKSPKKAKVYWFVTVNTTSDPYTNYYTVDMMGTRNIVNLQLYLGFKMDHRVNLYLRQVVEDLIENDIIDEQPQKYTTMPGRKIGDFRFIIIQELLSPNTRVRGWQHLLISARIFIQNHSTNPIQWFGLEFSEVKVEKVPLLLKKRRIPAMEQRMILNPKDVKRSTKE